MWHMPRSRPEGGGGGVTVIVIVLLFGVASLKAKLVPWKVRPRPPDRGSTAEACVTTGAGVGKDRAC